MFLNYKNQVVICWFWKIITTYSKNHTKPANKICGQNTELLNSKEGDTY
jgi:hypothetical protein